MGKRKVRNLSHEDSLRFTQLYDAGVSMAEIGFRFSRSASWASLQRDKLMLGERGMNACPKESRAEKRALKNLTLCWRCKKSTNMNLCTWANPDNPQPVEGWEAKPYRLRIGDEIEMSYEVIECPNFEEG